MIQRQVFEHVSVNDQEDRTKKVYRMLAIPMTKSQITRKTQWLGKRERNEILETLIESGMVEYQTIENESAGAPKTVFKRTDVNLA
jgi:predicted ArsR family transcriptional regulator